ncbi:hypothetical protein GCM10011491_07320 [Brucella endophytica]|uniref:Mu-like prophage I protein n=1 Tax=Brucella endophytica TaxID=1963359 RepID=A0A916WB79_9HYPH|nr:phage protease [Brucella endophytica]GGA82439.1 hypothetical protein GCM10011491_07320 [Brucella endophytica]
MTGQPGASADIVAMSAAALPVADAAVPEWLHVLPLGEFSGVDGRGPYRNDDPGALISRFHEEGRKLAVDENHSTDLAAKKGFSAPARGWIVELQKRDDGIWGRVEWTPEGRALMQSKAYGYVSPVFISAAKAPLVVRKLLRVALTNDPNLTSLKALHSARKGPDMDHEQLLSALRTALDLGAEADGAAILDAVNKLSQSRHSADPAQFVPIAMFQATVAELNKLRSGISQENAERIADAAIRNGKLLPFMRDWAVNLCQANKAAFDDFLEGAGKPVGEFITSLQTKYDFKHSQLNGKTGDAQLGEVHRNLGHSAEDVKTYGGKADK